jgi:LysM repeat protein
VAQTGGAAVVTGGGDVSSVASGGRGATTNAGRGAASPARTHKVQAGETPSSIAKRYGVKLDTLMAANPGLNPTRMKVGQSVNVPAP